MKITRRQLRRIIKEEMTRVINEGSIPSQKNRVEIKNVCLVVEIDEDNKPIVWSGSATCEDCNAWPDTRYAFPITTSESHMTSKDSSFVSPKCGAHRGEDVKWVIGSFSAQVSYDIHGTESVVLDPGWILATFDENEEDPRENRFVEL